MTTSTTFPTLSNLDTAESYLEATRRAAMLGWAEGVAWVRAGHADSVNPLASTRTSICPPKAKWTGAKVASAIGLKGWRILHKAALRAAFANAFDAAVVATVIASRA